MIFTFAPSAAVAPIVVIGVTHTFAPIADLPRSATGTFRKAVRKQWFTVNKTVGHRCTGINANGTYCGETDELELAHVAEGMGWMVTGRCRSHNGADTIASRLPAPSGTVAVPIFPEWVKAEALAALAAHEDARH